MAAPPVVHVAGLRKTYGRTVAVDDVSFEVEEGEIFGLIGPNGAGKTTTMECACGLRRPDRGTVSVLGRDPRQQELQNLIGVQLQQAQLQKRIKVWEAVDLWAALYPRTIDGDELLERLGLAAKRDAWFMNLSGGQKQRLFIAAHVFLKLALTAATLGLLVLAGKRFYPVTVDTHVPSFVAALLLATLSILSIGFVIASAVPTARFAQPAGSFVLYPLLAVSGLFAPVDALSPFWRQVAHFSPVTYAVSLLQGIWVGEPWSQHLLAIGALVLNLAMCTAVSAKIFRWE